MRDEITLNNYHKELYSCRDKLERLDRVRLKYMTPITSLEEIRTILTDNISNLEKKIDVFNPRKRFQKQDTTTVEEART